MFRPKNEKERILHRLKIIQGHYKKVVKMVEDDVYCIDILHQSQAVQKAMHEVDNILLEQHLAGCVTDAMHKHENQEQVIKEIMGVFKRKSSR